MLNEIKGMNGAGTEKAEVPKLFGLNIQIVSVGQKLPESGPGHAPGLFGGYTGPDAKPGDALAAQMDFVHGALGRLMANLWDAMLDKTTLVIVSAKHNYLPIDPARLRRVDDDPYIKIPGYAFHIADDAALIWLKSDGRDRTTRCGSRLPGATSQRVRHRPNADTRRPRARLR